MYQTVLFDLDGTLTDPGEGITNSVAYALKKREIEVADRKNLYCFIGPPLLDSFMKYYGFSKVEAMQAIHDYREYFSDRGIFENVPYEGIHAMLQTLKAQGKKLVLATSKPEAFAVRILERFDLAPYFDIAAGATMDEKRSKKGDVIAYALTLLTEDEKRNIVMVGDREHDILGAKENGLPAIGVLYGYGSREELEQAGPAAIAETVDELITLL